MFFKIMGGVIVVLASCVIGVYYSFKVEYRIEDLSEMKKALTLLSSEIEFNLSTLAEAMKNISLKVRSPIKDIFEEFSMELEKRTCKSGELWENIMNKYFCDTYFEREDIESFISFGHTLGYLDAKQQNNNINLCVEYINNKISELKEKSYKNKKMYKSLGLFGGIVIMVIIF